MRLPLLSLAGALVVGLTVLTPQAQAGGFLYPVSGYEAGPRFDRPLGGPDGWRGGPRFDRPWGYGPRPHGRGPESGQGFGPGFGHGPRHARGGDCVVRVNRYFDGFAWVSERRRVCR